MEQIKLQYVPDGVHPVVHVSQGDIGRQFQLLLFDGNVAYSMPAGTTAQVDGVKPDGHAFSYTDCVSVSDNVVTVTTKLQMTIISGKVTCEIRFTKDGNDIGTLNFLMLVEPSPVSGDTDLSDTELPAIIALAREQEANAEAWAKGTKNGIPVSSDAVQYHNNSKYYSEQSAIDATNSANSANQSAESASQSANSASRSADSALQSEAWAIGTKNGVPVQSDETQYNNNSKYWCRQSEYAAQGISAYIAILKIIIGTVYLVTESGDNLVTESGDKILIDF